MLLAALILGAWWPGTIDERLEHYVAEDGSRRPLHIFESGHAASRPAIMLFHGGAWQRGSPEGFFDQCRVLARMGYVCISAGYRVAERDGTRPEHALADARASWRYLIDNATRLGIDPRRIALGGGSAGGHLAALLATGQRERADPAEAAALILFNPMLDLSPGRPDHEYVQHDWELLSPLHQLRQRLPPTLILLGDRDPELPVESAEAFAAKARRLGADCRLAVARGQGHGFFNREYSRWQFHRTLYQTVRFLRDHGMSGA